MGILTRNYTFRSISYNPLIRFVVQSCGIIGLYKWHFWILTRNRTFRSISYNPFITFFLALLLKRIWTRKSLFVYVLYAWLPYSTNLIISNCAAIFNHIVQIYCIWHVRMSYSWRKSNFEATLLQPSYFKQSNTSLIN